MNRGVMLHRSCQDPTLCNVLSPLADQQAHMEQQFPTVARAEQIIIPWIIMVYYHNQYYNSPVLCACPCKPRFATYQSSAIIKLLLTLFWMPVFLPFNAVASLTSNQYTHIPTHLHHLDAIVQPSMQLKWDHSREVLHLLLGHLMVRMGRKSWIVHTLHLHNE